MKKKRLSEILDQTGLIIRDSDQNTWQNLRSEFDTLLKTHLQEHEILQQTLELGYQEMQKMLELVEHRDLLTKSIFDASQDIILTLDQRGQIIEYNRASEILLKVDGNSIMGQKLSSVIPKCAFIDDIFLHFSDAPPPDAISKLGKSYESTLVDAKGNELAVLVSLNRIQLRDHVIYPLYIKDLSAEKAASQALEESRSQLVLTSKMSALGEMAGGVAHEINTPLAIIQMRADQLLECAQDGSLDPTTLSEGLQTIGTTVKRIAKIVSGLRSFARDGRKDPMILFSVSKIVEETFSLCKERFSTHGVKLDYLAETDVNIDCRPGEITQVLLNMLNNAFDAVQSSPEKWVKIELESTESSISLRVTDSGPGISADLQKKIFQPFFTTKEIGKGTGLGLSISKGLIESHGGKLHLDTTSANTSLIISLPLRKKNDTLSA